MTLDRAMNMHNVHEEKIFCPAVSGTHSVWIRKVRATEFVGLTVRCISENLRNKHQSDRRKKNSAVALIFDYTDANFEF